MKNYSTLMILLIVLGSLCGACRTRPLHEQQQLSEAEQKLSEEAEQAYFPFRWENANVYFLLTDRFHNGNRANDLQFDRNHNAAMLRGFEGGDLEGVIQKIEEGYFDDLGITAIWTTPWFEQIHGGTDEGTGMTYAFHGYWIGDWTSIDPNFGNEALLHKLVETAHAHNIRVVMDVIVNHTGPVTDIDPVWPEEWVRTSPQCRYQTYESTISCTLVKNLPDILTESNEEVDLPPQLIEKWEKEGRLEQELAELDAFFERTAYPRAPRFYIIKWLSDYIREYGIDGFRIDTAKHTEESVWAELWKEASRAFSEWKRKNPDKVMDDSEFWMVGEVYNYNINNGRWFDFGDKKVDFFAQEIHSLINFGFKYDAEKDYESLFSSYSRLLHNELKGQGVLNYLSSHDDGHPFDPERNRPMEAATKLLLSPGASQIYYGDELCRPLIVDGAEGDANLRSLMDWSLIGSEDTANANKILEHYQKLGRFRRGHPAVGAGIHQMISKEPYLFSRSYEDASLEDLVLIGLDLEPGLKILKTGSVFKDGSELRDAYSGWTGKVRNGQVSIDSEHGIVLLEKLEKAL